MSFTATQTHFAIWARRNRPSWAKDLSLPVGSSVDSCINVRANVNLRGFIDVDNALALLKLVDSNHRRSTPYGRETNVGIAKYMAEFKSVGHDTKRGKWYARWTRRLKKS